jgi:hypothetical protein
MRQSPIFQTREWRGAAIHHGFQLLEQSDALHGNLLRPEQHPPKVLRGTAAWQSASGMKKVDDQLLDPASDGQGNRHQVLGNDLLRLCYPYVLVVELSNHLLLALL